MQIIKFQKILIPIISSLHLIENIIGPDEAYKITIILIQKVVASNGIFIIKDQIL